MAMLLVVATTEATDPTRVSKPFRTTANASDTTTTWVRDDTRGVAWEVRVGENVSMRLAKNWCLPNQWNLGSVSLGEGGNANGQEEGREEVLKEEVTTTSSVVCSQSVTSRGYVESRLIS